MKTYVVYLGWFDDPNDGWKYYTTFKAKGVVDARKRLCVLLNKNPQINYTNDTSFVLTEYNDEGRRILHGYAFNDGHNFKTWISRGTMWYHLYSTGRIALWNEVYN